MSRRTDATGAGPARRPERILVVDDEAVLRKIIARVLERSGYEVTVAGSASEAEAVLDDGAEPDLVLCDVSLCGVHGADAVRRVRERCPGIPAILMSGSDPEEVDRTGEGDEELPFLAKPFEPGELVRRIRDVLDAPEGDRRNDSTG